MAVKSLFIAEKPSVAREFAAALHEPMQRHDGWLESENAVVTWCVGHLVTMSYPDRYDEKLKKWTFDSLPFLPGEFRYEVIPSVKKQFGIVKGLLLRRDIGTIYVCTDSGREGEYIYRLVAMMAGSRTAESRNASGSIHRRKKRSCVESVKRKTFPRIIRFPMPPFFARRKII